MVEKQILPIVVVKSGTPLTTGVVTDPEVLLVVFVSPPPLTVAGGTTKGLPICDAVGMNGTLKVLLAPLAIEAGFVHVAVIPLVVQVQPLLLVGKVPKLVPVGICTTSVISPLDGAVPTLATVTGILLG